MMRAIVPLLVAAALTGGTIACGAAGTPVSPSAIEEASLVHDLFSGTLPRGGLRSFAFTAPSSSAVSAMLASLATSASPSAADLRVGLGLGVPQGTGCAIRESLVTGPALTAQLRGLVPPGIHCVAIYDTGTLTEPVSFAIRITHY
jgi:hypothetical protein